MIQPARQLNNGFVVIATIHPRYLTSAVLLAESILDYIPDANITLYTTADLARSVDLSMFSDVVVEGVPNDRRAKLWALGRTPYDITAYLDADTVVVSEEIVNIFDQLGDRDIIFTKIRPYNSNRKGLLDDPRYLHHGGVFVYRRTPDVIAFMEQWWERWNTTRATLTFRQTYPNYPEKMKEWDQFYLFYIIHETQHNLNIGFFEEDARWNFVRGYVRSELNGKQPIIEHYTIKL